MYPICSSGYPGWRFPARSLEAMEYREGDAVRPLVQRGNALRELDSVPAALSFAGELRRRLGCQG